MKITRKSGDTYDLEAQLTSPTSFSLAGATVVMNMVDSKGVVKVSRGPVIVVDADEKRVKYEWGAGETDTPDEYRIEFEVTLADGKIITFPNPGFIHLLIVKDIA
jgi:hypothetical protein